VLWYYPLLVDSPRWSDEALGFYVTLIYPPFSLAAILVGGVLGFLVHWLFFRGRKAPRLRHPVIR
jgi:hypothetical protein